MNNIIKTSTRQCTGKYTSPAPYIKLSKHISPIIVPLKIDHWFSRNEELDRMIVHWRLGHVMDDKVNKMVKFEIM